MSGYADTIHGDRIDEAHVAGRFLAKPFDPRQLLEMVSSALRDDPARARPRTGSPLP
jgi:FixJ family two-component response regulator